ncbi:hypothetical protein K437DRAFT_254283 [Tilletiaria anomala UBC 951]|uniref:Transmembrane protein 135 N-terminal domain-containing protein n=1 Tax=Tilletiaria anomala (strain ATCC 24038 / CBS 436.72 / UBC 951) TaxID=1037660 RepID=A0A066WNW7_TILAU|nr:uncharacterized protein K437DRAFT_254283 [Tilletiaria anomala UBC 951]KDN52300.1 hypothetical protein K437DRAFT_254283 [Tilletiaria anomala UBC 951]
MANSRRTVSSGKDKPSFQLGGGDDQSDDDDRNPTVAISSGPSSTQALRTTESEKQPSIPGFAAASQRSGFRKDPSLKLPAFTSLTSMRDDEEDGSEDEELRWERYKSQPSTPNIAETAQQLRRSLSIHGLHELASAPKNGGIKHKIWRPENDPVREPGDWERLAVHVIRGGIRAGLVSFGLRGTVMLMFALLKLLRSRKFRGQDFVLAYFGVANGRFSAMFGLWAAIYKLVHNSLRLTTPPPAHSKSRKRRASSSTTGAGAAESAATEHDDGSGDSGVATPRSGYEKLQGKTDEEKAKIKSRQKRKAFMRDPRSRVWHAYVAGAVSALAVLVETKDMRVTLAQQLLVRGLEGSYNLAHGQGLIHVPYGSVLVFGLACGQIMFAWINAPESLPRSYVSWITRASQAGLQSTPVYRDLRDHNGTFDPSHIYKYFPDGKIPQPLSTNPLRYPPVAPTPTNVYGVTGKHVREFVKALDMQKLGEPIPHLPCSFMHPWENSHFWSPFDRFIKVTRWILPVYMTLYFVPAIFLRTRSFLKAPMRIILRSLFGSIRSSSFLGVFVIIFQVIFCGAHQLYDVIDANASLRANTPAWVKRMLLHQGVPWFAGFMTCLSLFVDDARRRAELAAYVLPKGMESAWSIARQRSWVPFVPGGDLLLTSMGMSMVMGTYAQSPEQLSGLVRRIIYQVSPLTGYLPNIAY